MFPFFFVENLNFNFSTQISFFLETNQNGGIFFPLISDSSKKMVKFSLDGSMQVNIDPTLKACDQSGGLYIPAKQGSAVLFYHLLPDGVMNGKIDPNTLYQYCTDQGSFISFFSSIFFFFFLTDGFVI